MQHLGLLQIAIDGPVGAGKSDISGRLAKELGLTYLYTGAMYRAFAYACKQEGVGYKDVPKLIPLLTRYTIDLVPPEKEGKRTFKVLLNNEDVTEKLFNPEIDAATSDVSTIPEVRKFMVKRQQEMAQGKSVVMEGRDIGYRVLPNAQLKIYLTASIEERAKRRQEMQVHKGIVKQLDETVKETKLRDEQDMKRTSDPLKKLPDAWELDTTGMSQKQVVDAIKKELQIRHLL